MPVVAAVEETGNPDEEPAKSGAEQGQGDDLSVQQPRAMVELGGQPYESGDKECVVQEAGSDITAGTAEAVPELT